MENTASEDAVDPFQMLLYLGLTSALEASLPLVALHQVPQKPPADLPY